MSAKTAAELVAELEQRRRDDPAYRAELERQESERAERLAVLRAAEQPVVADLRAIGLEVTSVWDLHDIPDSRPRAIPVLLEHLSRDYPEGVLAWMGHALADRSARAWWSELRALMLTTERDVVRDRIASALASCAVREHYDDLVAFLRDDRLGTCRIYFVRPVNQIGNRLEAGRGRAVVESVADDPDVGEEARAVLEGRSTSR